MRSYVKYYDVWYENDFKNINGFREYTENYTIYIQMELCNITLNEIKSEIHNELILKNGNNLTELGFYITNEIFGEILEGVKYLHNKNIIYRDLNIYIIFC